MKHYHLENNVLTLWGKPSSPAVRITLFTFAFIFLLAAAGMLIGLIINTSIGVFIGLVNCALGGFFLLRLALWNSFGSEKIQITDNQITYQADYKWFKASEKHRTFIPLSFSMQQAGFKEDNLGVFVIGEGEDRIICASKIPLEEFGDLLSQLRKYTNKFEHE